MRDFFVMAGEEHLDPKRQGTCTGRGWPAVFGKAPRGAGAAVQTALDQEFEKINPDEKPPGARSPKTTSGLPPLPASIVSTLDKARRQGALDYHLIIRSSCPHELPGHQGFESAEVGS